MTDLSRLGPRPRFLVKHVGNLGDMIFFVPPILTTLKRLWPESHVTFVTAWGFKTRHRHFGFGPKFDFWGPRNQSGFCLHAIQTNPYIDQLVHYHSTRTSLTGDICTEDGVSYPTWSQSYYEKQKQSDNYDAVFELDIGLSHTGNPLTELYRHIGLPNETYSKYEIFLTDHDKEIASIVTKSWPHPRIVILESIESSTTRGWDPKKIPILEQAITSTYSVPPIWFGAKYTPNYHNQPLTLRQNIATLTFADIAIGVLSGPLHMAAAVNTPTITLYADSTIERAAPAYFLNKYIDDPNRRHHTIIAPDTLPYHILKSTTPPASLTPVELKFQKYRSWQNPGQQSTKSSLAAITVDEVMETLRFALP